VGGGGGLRAVDSPYVQNYRLVTSLQDRV